MCSGKYSSCDCPGIHCLVTILMKYADEFGYDMTGTPTQF